MPVYFAQIGHNGPVKIGYSASPDRRIEGLSNFYRKDVTLLCVLAGNPIQEEGYHRMFVDCRLPGRGELFLLSGALANYVARRGLKTKIFHKYRTRSEFKRTAGIMTPKRIAQVGKLLNGGMSGPKVAAKLKISTASVYANWKQVGPHRFVRKRKKK